MKWDDLRVGMNIVMIFPNGAASLGALTSRQRHTGVIKEIDNATRVFMIEWDSKWDYLGMSKRAAYSDRIVQYVQQLHPVSTPMVVAKDATIKAPAIDPVEARVYAFFTAPPAGCCPCGILLHTNCKYHP